MKKVILVLTMIFTTPAFAGEIRMNINFAATKCSGALAKSFAPSKVIASSKSKTAKSAEAGVAR